MNDQMITIPHPPFPISCGRPDCCTGTLGENVTTPCTNPYCGTRPSHPASFHRYDDAVISIAETRGVEKIFDRAFEAIHEGLPDFDAPYPTEYENSPNGELLDEWRDWITAAVIRHLAR